MLSFSPLDQFNIYNYLFFSIKGYDISITNSTIYLFICIYLLRKLFQISLNDSKLIPNNWQLFFEEFYKFIIDLIDSGILHKKGRKYTSFIFTLFIFLVTLNLLGMIPFSFTVTSHLIVTVSFSVLIFIFVTILALSKHKLHFFSFFLPEGVPIFLIPLFVPIEFFSYCSRSISLGVRLFANLMSGHALLKILAGFVVQMLQASIILSLFSTLPIILLVALTGLEIIVALIQAYIFTMLTTMYLNDAIHLH